MFKLLVAVDGSEHSFRAVDFAVRLAKEHGRMSIHLVTAHEDPDVYGEIAVYVRPEKMLALQREHADMVLGEAKHRIGDAQVECSTEALVGHVPLAITQRAEELRCDCIVLGSRGMTNLGNIVMGSVASKVAHLATIPVTLVR